MFCLGGCNKKTKSNTSLFVVARVCLCVCSAEKKKKNDERDEKLKKKLSFEQPPQVSFAIDGVVFEAAVVTTRQDVF